jgi:hypothetical protein
MCDLLNETTPPAEPVVEEEVTEDWLLKESPLRCSNIGDAVFEEFALGRISVRVFRDVPPYVPGSAIYFGREHIKSNPTRKEVLDLLAALTPKGTP